ncbi:MULTISPECIES: winged helix-turn-helix domain-containing protein [Kitasatospora]|uniref:winged helix-turn-helix domain-containing protein n=1 Tax=Kitasatospora TaxID=2063 RepID=UPI000CBE9365|nr:helix-turn-helix domain-containing protein [Kitasatospora sp. GP30]MDH6138847.1 DNA-binding transcriptional ArsR family regulator [Kitasatospora sp. GP30]
MNDDMNDEQPTPQARTVDPRSLRALAHPLRMRILDLLTDEGPATSAKLAERLGENTGTLSWHLRRLAEHGFINEDQERGTKRERWWQRSSPKMTFNSAELTVDPATAQALDVYKRHYLERSFQRAARALATPLTPEWVGTGNMSDWGEVWMTPEQLGALGAELLAVIRRHAPEPDAPRPAEARPVLIQFQTLPMFGPDSATDEHATDEES